ncbi:Uncharacterised protein [Streptococcus pneumoniae]|nr:Uncharacterised protein [Streptococcus pneumoniae]
MRGHKRGQAGGGGGEILRGELVGAGGGPRDEVGDPNAAGVQLGEVLGLVAVGGVDQVPGEPGTVQGWVEAVAAAGEVRTGGGGPQAGVDADEQQPQRVRQQVGDGAVAELLKLSLSEAHVSSDTSTGG